jgi:hypothetical protein
MADLASIAGATRESIGRYFSLVSAIPSFILTVWTFLLIRSGAWWHSPDVSQAIGALSGLGFSGVAALTFATIVTGLVLHPLQFTFVQLTEGYWGSGQIATEARSRRMWWYWRRLTAQRLQLANANSQLNNRPAAGHDPDPRGRLRLVAARDEAGRVHASQPRNLDQVMPTRLGNVLRYYEAAAGAPYGLNAIRVMPYLARVAPSGDMAYVTDQRSLLDLAIRMTVISLIACAVSTLFLWQRGIWLLLALVPYVIGWLSYRGAVVAAGEYGRALAAVIALNRFTLYDRLNIPRPTDTNSERTANKTLGLLLAYNPRVSVTYRPPGGETSPSGSSTVST